MVLIPSLANWNKLWLLLVASGALALIDHIVRDKGRKVQGDLWDSWGGPPTTQALRHAGAVNQALLSRRHKQLSLLLEEQMPNRRQELRNPQKADEKYEMAVRYLIARTRDTSRFHLVFLENCHYGFRRNMYGMRAVGLVISLSVGAGTLGTLAASLYDFVVWKSGFAVVSVISFLLFVFWWRVVNSAWVRSAANNYAERLLDSLDVLLPIESEQAPTGNGQN
ncbi:hypothetical protein [Streptomyces sp. SS162]|uniref:hypothetical protein n=1 Tax=Streptomyces sp. SS162 TaxID=3108484 RepID=UPI002F400E45